MEQCGIRFERHEWGVEEATFSAGSVTGVHGLDSCCFEGVADGEATA